VGSKQNSADSPIKEKSGILIVQLVKFSAGIAGQHLSIKFAQSSAPELVPRKKRGELSDS
jgi:hypothetical protein